MVYVGRVCDGHRWVWIGLLLGALLAAPAAAQQAETVESTRARARELFDAGSQAFEAGEYADALTAFEASYALVPRPEILFNAARSAEEAGQPAVALRYYTQLAASSNSAEERASLEAAVERVRALAASEGSAGEGSAGEESAGPVVPESSEPQRAGPVVSAEAPPEQAPVWPWGLAGGGALALVVGVVLTVVGALDVNAINATPDGTRSWSDVAPDADRAHALLVAGSVTMGVGATAAGVGVGLALAPGGSEDSAVFFNVGARF